MSHYTTEVRFICENYAGYTKSQPYDEYGIIETAAPKIFESRIPIFDEDYRLPLETRILRHYYTREIGQETVGLFKHFLNTRMCEIMPYYNQLYSVIMQEGFNLLYDTDYYKKVDDTLNGTKHTDGTIDHTHSYNSTLQDNKGTTASKNIGDTVSETNLYSDTPQGGISGLTDNTYLTNATIDNKSENQTVTANQNSNQTASTSDSGNLTDTHNIGDTIKNIDDYLAHVYGKVSPTESYIELMWKYRDKILNVDNMIIENLSDLFLNLW